MRILNRLVLVAGTGIAMAGLSSPASAQATRTWVSGVGDDVNPCSRTAPCKTFAGAISKTAANGEINCLDPGGFGTVTITKPVEIICDYTEGGVAATGTTGVTVKLANSGDHVLLSGLDILGGSQGSGVRMVGPGMVHVRNSTIRMFSGAAGVSFEPTGNATLLVTGSTISSNKTGIATLGAGTGRVIVGDSTIIANVTGLSASGGSSIVSTGNNMLILNGSDGQFGLSLARQ